LHAANMLGFSVTPDFGWHLSISLAVLQTCNDLLFSLFAGHGFLPL